MTKENSWSINKEFSNKGHNLSTFRENMTQKEQEYLAKNQLTNIAKGFLSICSDESVRNIIYQEIDKKFDGDNNVLIKNLLEEAFTRNHDLKTEINDFLRANTVEADLISSLDAFKNIKGQNFYPQLYIPFYDKLKKEGVLGTKLVTIVPFVATEEKNKVFDGFQVTIERKINQISYIDEDYASKNEVWVISLNEVVDNDGKLSQEYFKAGRIEEAEAINQARFTSMGVRGHRESWVNGMNDVCIKSVLGWPTGVNPYTGITEPSNYIQQGNLIRKYAKYEADAWLSVPMSYVYIYNWDQVTGTSTGAKGNHLYYVIYESDAWPTQEKQVTIIAPVVGGIPIYIGYRSADWPFDENIITYSQAVTIGYSRTSIDTKFVLGLL